MSRKYLHDNTHLTLDERKIIEAGITNNSTKAAIAATIGKDATTVAKEIRKHRILKPRNTYHRPVMCDKLNVCPHKPCKKKCEFFQEPKCKRRDKTPGACNGCENGSKCLYDKYYYKADMQSSQKAHVENAHNYVRDIIPNGYPLDNLSQSDLDLMFSHINSTPRLSLNGKTPFEVFSFFYGDSAAQILRIKPIARDDVVLKPCLIFNKK